MPKFLIVAPTEAKDISVSISSVNGEMMIQLCKGEFGFGWINTKAVEKIITARPLTKKDTPGDIKEDYKYFYAVENYDYPKYKGLLPPYVNKLFLKEMYNTLDNE